MKNQQTKEMYKERIARYQEALEFLDYLPDSDSFSFPVRIDNPSILTSSTTIHIKLPYSVECFRQWRQAMGKGWKMKDWVTTQHDNSVSKHVSYIRPELSPDGKDYLNPISVSIAMDTDIGKSTCHIKQIGIKEVPVWEVVCE